MKMREIIDVISTHNALTETDVRNNNVFFHVSRRVNRDSISRHGLMPQNVENNNIMRVPGIYMFDDFAQAKDWAFWSALEWKESADIWEVVLSAEYVVVADTHPEMAENFDAFVGYFPIPPSNVRVAFTQTRPRSTDVPPPLSRKNTILGMQRRLR